MVAIFPSAVGKVIVTVLAICGPSPVHATIRIGTYFSSVGSHSLADGDSANGLNFWAAVVNARGGVVVGNVSHPVGGRGFHGFRAWRAGAGVTVVIVNRDPQSNVTLAPLRVKQLVEEDKVDFVIGGNAAHITPVVSYLESVRMINVQCCTGAPSAWTTSLKYTWGVYGPVNVYAKSFFKFFGVNGYDRAGVLIADGSISTKAVGAATGLWAQTYGFTVSNNATWSSTDFSKNSTNVIDFWREQFAKMRSDTTDVFLGIASNAAEAEALAKLLAELKIDYKGVYITVASASNFVQNVGPVAAEYLMSQSMSDSTFSETMFLVAPQSAILRYGNGKTAGLMSFQLINK
ncbi:hypothetical protein HK104_009657 [Borealophlyctis nickersoniae]|nr:hypothetical protein HK104_009657 [Borealophlyctis nickersoniae]